MSNLFLFDSYVLLAVSAVLFAALALGAGVLLVAELLRLLYRTLHRRARVNTHLQRAALTVEVPNLAGHVDGTVGAGFARPLRIDPDLTDVLGVPTQVIDTSRFRRPQPVAEEDTR